MRIPIELKQAKRRVTKLLMSYPRVTRVQIGHVRTGGRVQPDECISVGVVQKIAKAELEPIDTLPRTLRDIWEGIHPPLPKACKDIRVDVIQTGDIKISIALDVSPDGVGPHQFTNIRRPCPGGYSIGHEQVTAGTLGTWVTINGEHFILSNNHVIANSNGASINDLILQPGRADGGNRSNPRHHIARLSSFVPIVFDGDGGKKKIGAAAWRAWLAPANAVAKIVNCPYRARVSPQRNHNVNLVDAALAKVLRPRDVDPDIVNIGEIENVRDPQLDARVRKSGRTTETTSGRVTGIDATVRVNYGSGRLATMDEQFEITAEQDGDFSAGGDSGSAIVSMQEEFMGLLFAGGGGLTYANKASNVVSLLGGFRV